jgi:IS30 family transposase
MPSQSAKGPPEVEDRAIPGHREGDLLSGAKNSYIATLVERHSRFAMLIKVPGKDTEVVVAALSWHVRKLPATLRRSLTWDRGLEMAKHKSFTVATRLPRVDFAQVLHRPSEPAPLIAPLLQFGA